MSAPYDHHADQRLRKSDRLARVIDDCITRRTSGEVITDQSLIDANPGLMPELAEQLRRLSVIERGLDHAETESGNASSNRRCPECGNPLELDSGDPNPSHAVCSACEIRFRLTNQRLNPEPGGLLGRFEIINKLGEGAFGSVWCARDAQLDRLVAIKVAHGGYLPPGEADRFVHEARTVARLRHPHIVRVHEVGREGDIIFLVADYVLGENLAKRAALERTTPGEAAELCAKLAAALDHAHQHGVVHRDLKPSNIMIDEAGEPHLMDFGLAKREDHQCTMTMDGKLLGTPSYMSPEQARGTAHDADRRSDVYSLGVILYELITGERPFRGNTRMLVHQILFEDAPALRNLTPTVPKDLEAVCLKCLEKAPRQRYQTAAELVDDLNRFLAKEPTLARPITFAARKWRWCKRNSLASSLAGAMAVTVVVALASVTWLWIQAVSEADRASALATRETAARRAAEYERQRAEKQARLRRRRQYLSEIAAAQQAWEANDFERCVTLLRRHVPAPDEKDLRNFEWYYLWKLCQPGLAADAFELDSLCSSVAFAPDGSLAAGGMTILQIRRPRDLSLRTVLEHVHVGPITDLEFRPPEYRSLATCSLDGNLKLWTPDSSNTAAVLHGTGTFDTEHRFCSLTFSPEGKKLATNDPETGGFLLWDVDSKTSVAFQVDGEAGGHVRVRNIAFSPDGTHLALTSEEDGVVRLWNVATHEQHGLWRHEPGKADAIAFSPDGSMLASTGHDKLIRVGDVATRQVKLTLEGHTGYIYSVAFSPDGRTLASGSWDNTVKLWSTESGSLRRTLKGHSRMVADVAFSPDGGTLASAAWDSKVKLWDLSTTPAPNKLEGGLVTYSSDGKTLMTCKRNSLRFWDASTGKLVDFPLAGLLEGEPSIVSERDDANHYAFQGVCAISPDQRCFAAASRGDEIDVWTLPGLKRSTLTGRVSPVEYLEFSADGSVLASASGNELKLWHVATSQTCGDFEVFRGAYTPSASYAFSIAPDGKTIAFSKSVNDGDFIFEVWDIENNERLRVHPFPTPVVTTTFSADGALLAAGCVDGLVTVWSMDSGEAILKQRTMRAVALAFSPDGTRLASGADQSIRLWTIPGGEPVITFREHTGQVYSLDFSPDGKTLASSGEDNTVLLYRAATNDTVVGPGGG